MVKGHPALLKSVWQRPEGAGCRRVRATRAEAMRGVRGALRAQRGGRAAQSAAESHREHLWRYNPELEAEGKTRSLQRAAVGYTGLPQGRAIRFRSKAIPEGGCRRDIRRRPRERPMALQELPQNVRYCMVIIIERADAHIKKTFSVLLLFPFFK